MHSSFIRRPLVAAALAFATACSSLPAMAANPVAAVAPADKLQRALDKAMQQARPGQLGAAVLDLRSGAQARVNGAQAFPMMSVFKAPVAAAVLSRIDDGSLSLKQPVTITRDQVLDGSAVPSIGERFRGEQMSFTIDELLTAAVSQSDNTAVDALIRVIGGPQVVTAYLHAHGIEGMRIDLPEGGLSRIFNDLRPGETVPVNETAQAKMARRQRGYQAFLADPRNRSTPDAAVDFLRKLHGNELLSTASTQHLLRLMAEQTIPNRMRAGLPKGMGLADKTGSSGTTGGRTAAYNDIGILTWPDGRVVIIAAFLFDSPASVEARDAVFADLARSVAEASAP